MFINVLFCPCVVESVKMKKNRVSLASAAAKCLVCWLGHCTMESIVCRSKLAPNVNISCELFKKNTNFNYVRQCL